MPRVSLVVCLYRERAFLERLLSEAEGCYDDLVVIHDGPEQADTARVRSLEDPELPPESLAIDYSEQDRNSGLLPYFRPAPRFGESSIQALVEAHAGRYFEGPRCFQQEPHWPFAWSEAKYDWILRLDADEFPDQKMREWLQEFRSSAEPAEAIAGYTCIWPLWDGQKAVCPRWPKGRLFLLNRQRVRFFGMVEQIPVPDTEEKVLDLTLHHQPNRPSYGIRNILIRPQAYRWRTVIAKALKGTPHQLPRWRWREEGWPGFWEVLRRRPLRTAFARLIRLPIEQAKDMLKVGYWPRPSACLNPGLHHFMLGLTLFREKYRMRN